MGGENLSPTEIEAHLMTHPSVLIAQALGIPDPRLDEIPVAFVELRAGMSATEEELIALLPGSDRALQGPAPRPLRHRMADVGHQGPEVPPARADPRRT